MSEGFIKIYRSMEKWQWKDIPEMVALWVEILLKANFAEREYHGETFEAGSFPTSIEKLAAATGLTSRTVRTCLDRFRKTGEISVKSTNKGTKITVINWALYQGCDEEVTNDRQASDKQPTSKRQTSDNSIRNKESKKERSTTFGSTEKERKFAYGDYSNVLLKDSEKTKLDEEFGTDATRQAIDFLDSYIEEKGYKSKSHYLAIRRWVLDAVKEKPKHIEHKEVYEMDLGGDNGLRYM